MIEVRVRHENEVDLWKLVCAERALDEAQRANRADPEADADTAEEDRIGEDTDAVEIDEHGCVPQPRQRDGVVAPLRRRGTMGSAGDVAADLAESSAHETRRPHLRAAEPGARARQGSGRDEMSPLHD